RCALVRYGRDQRGYADRRLRRGKRQRQNGMGLFGCSRPYQRPIRQSAQKKDRGLGPWLLAIDALIKPVTPYRIDTGLNGVAIAAGKAAGVYHFALFRQRQGGGQPGGFGTGQAGG